MQRPPKAGPPLAERISASQRSFGATRLRMTQSGFTFIEILMTLTVIAVLFIPVMQLFTNSLYSTNVNLDLITATNLAQSEMERTINLNLTKAQLQEIGTQVTPPVEQKPIEMNHSFWRIKREIVENTDPLEVRVVVYKEGESENSMVSLVTLIEDLMWDSVKTISAT